MTILDQAARALALSQSGVDEFDALDEHQQQTLRENAAAVLRAGADWQPIETAPKDGSWIAVTSTHNQYYRAALQWEYDTWTDVNEADHAGFMADAATHWMPLPPPPTALGEE